jgi:hypothetical protein
MLQALSGWLAKAAAQKPDAEAEALLSARLAPDMFPLSTQIRFACVQAYEGVYRLRGAAFPTSLTELLDEGRNAGERPGSLDMDPDSPIAHQLANGMIFDLTAEQYVRDWMLGQFYFHIMTAYSILRSAGVDIGKADYIPHMLPYLRQAG